ncbi:non-canonical purine NTP phosphatase [Shewanella sp. NFH-SH190041]|nr:non-canonical purine NTP phosphatase [Shewanella sp. NFH-SH190041]
MIKVINFTKKKRIHYTTKTLEQPFTYPSTIKKKESNMNNTINLLVGSQNPVKIQAARDAMAQYFPHAILICHGINAPSGVPAQPLTEEKTRQGALNRLDYCCAQQAADYYLTMEGGVDNFADGPATFAYIALADADGRRSVGRSANLPLPQQVFDDLLNGEELGAVMDRLFHTHNIKQAGGAIGLLTRGEASRASIYTQAILLAMAPLLHPGLYRGELPSPPQR